jgi:hypothetical protein
MDLNVEKRKTRVAESLLENEALTADLDDSAAKELLNWILEHGKGIAQDTFGLSDQEADEAMYPRLKGLRRMCRSINKFSRTLGHTKSIDETLPILRQIIKRAAPVYGTETTIPTDASLTRFILMQLSASPTEHIIAIRSFVDETLGGSDPPQASSIRPSERNKYTKTIGGLLDRDKKDQ